MKALITALTLLAASATYADETADLMAEMRAAMAPKPCNVQIDNHYAETIASKTLYIVHGRADCNGKWISLVAADMDGRAIEESDMSSIQGGYWKVTFWEEQVIKHTGSNMQMNPKIR